MCCCGNCIFQGVKIQKIVEICKKICIKTHFHGFIAPLFLLSPPATDYS